MSEAFRCVCVFADLCYNTRIKVLWVHGEAWLVIRHPLTVSQQLLGHQTVLAVSQDEGEEGEDERVHYTHDGKDVGPAYRAGPQRVLVRLLAAHPLHFITVPTVWVDHAAQDQTRT